MKERKKYTVKGKKYFAKQTYYAFALLYIKTSGQQH